MATLWPVASIFATGIADLFIQVTRFGALMLDPLLRTRGETLGVTMVNLGWFGIVQYCMENHHFFNGFVSTISTGPFSSSQTVSHYQRVLMENSEMMGIYT